MAFNTHIYAQEWAAKLQERLTEPNKFKEICNVEYTNIQVLNNPYLTEATVQTGSRGSPYAFQAIVENNESVTYNTFKILPQVIDRADLAQSTFLKQMDLADKQAILLNEAIETAVYADWNNMTVLQNTDLGGSSACITVSVNNVDDICRAIRQKIRAAGGESLFERNGGFVVWRPGDMTLLETFAQASGFNTADNVLKNGVGQGFNYLGLTHYTSNLLAANHVIAGVKKVYHVGILKDTYGQIMVDEKDPTGISGVSVVSRVDFGTKMWTNVKPVVYNIQVV